MKNRKNWKKLKILKIIIWKMRVCSVNHSVYNMRRYYMRFRRRRSSANGLWPGVNNNTIIIIIQFNIRIFSADWVRNIVIDDEIVNSRNANNANNILIIMERMYNRYYKSQPIYTSTYTIFIATWTIYMADQKL